MTKKPLSDFSPRGNLRSNIKYSWIGEIHKMSIKEISSYSNREDEKRTSYSLLIEDCYGFRQSLWKKTQTLEGCQICLQQLPHNQTLLTEGDVNIRKGQIFFNISAIKYPDGTRFAFREYQEEKEKKGEENAEHETYQD